MAKSQESRPSTNGFLLNNTLTRWGVITDAPITNMSENLDTEQSRIDLDNMRGFLQRLLDIADPLKQSSVNDSVDLTFMGMVYLFKMDQHCGGMLILEEDRDSRLILRSLMRDGLTSGGSTSTTIGLAGEPTSAYMISTWHNNNFAPVNRSVPMRKGTWTIGLPTMQTDS